MFFNITIKYLNNIIWYLYFAITHNKSTTMNYSYDKNITNTIITG